MAAASWLTGLETRDKGSTVCSIWTSCGRESTVMVSQPCDSSSVKLSSVDLGHGVCDCSALVRGVNPESATVELTVPDGGFRHSVMGEPDTIRMGGDL